MSRSARATREVKWHLTTVFGAAVLAVFTLATVGLLFSRPDIIAIGLPLALWAATVLLKRTDAATIATELVANPGDTGDTVVSRIQVHADAEIAQVLVTQGLRARSEVDAAARNGAFGATTLLQHSGPSQLLALTARLVSLDGACVSDQTSAGRLDWNAAPRERPIPVLPLAPRLTGLHGTHEGGRPGQGGDFRDIHPFAPGDELRRVDWRATARLARRPGELLVRRNNALSDASIVIVMDTADDLGESVASWGRGEPERSGPTSLDAAREAARSIAAAAIADGDRVAFHDLSKSGHTVRSSAGSRHLARLTTVISATGESGLDVRVKRTPSVPVGSVIYVLSTFFDGAAADLAVMWRAAGNRVVAVDTLPTLDEARLTDSQRYALRTLLAERVDVFHDLAHAGVNVVAWGKDPDAAVIDLRLTARARR